MTRAHGTTMVPFRRRAGIGRLVQFLALFGAVALQLSAASWSLTGALGAHDPSIIKEGSTWWCFTTGTGLPVKYSSDGLNWNQGVQIFAAELPWWRTYASQMAHLDVWAPDVHYFAGRYWCYYCVSEFGTNNSAIGLTSCSSIATGDWRDDGVVLSSKSGVQTFNALDPDLAIDATGKPWLVYGSYFDGIHVVNIDPTTMKPTGTATSIAVRSNGIEGSNIVYQDGYYYLFVSIDQCCMGVNSTYKIAYSRSTSITGPYADQGGVAMLSGGGTVLDSSGPRWKGPGGQSVVQVGRDWVIAFHAYDANNNGAPILQISDLYWDASDWPTFSGPILPVFTQQPSDQTVTAGAGVTFSAAASGSPTPTFQWLKNGSAISGATSSSFSIGSTNVSDAGTYAVVATNGAGSVQSNGANLTVNAATTSPAIVTQPANQITGVGRAVQFSVSVSGNPQPSLQWQRFPAGGGSWTSLADGGGFSGSQTATLSIASVSLSLNGDQYRCVASNSAGTATSNVASLSVSVVTSDFNGDAAPDLVWQNLATGERGIWFIHADASTGNASLGHVASDWSIAATADFNGDGQDDLVWQNHTTGECVIWFMNGTTFVSSLSLGTFDLAWLIAGAGDFNSDGQVDLVWENTSTGERVVWLMTGSSYVSSLSLGVVPANWTISGLADFDRDGKVDLLWTNTTTGERSIWLMNGATQVGGVSLGIVPANLQFSGAGDYDGDGWPDILVTNRTTGERLIWQMNGGTHVGTVSLGVVTLDWTLGFLNPRAIQLARLDFNGDGQTDLVWENTATGEHYLWLMNGTNLTSSVSLGTLPLEWRIAATGDFNGDGQPDLVWENSSTGERVVWLMNGTNYAGSVALGTLDPAWHIADTGDFNADGKADLVWENTSTGERYLWLMNGGTFVSSVSLGVTPVEWRIAAAGDFNGDGQPDLVWENTTTGEHYVWLMNGTSFSSSVYLTTMPTVWRVATDADFNGDGKPDLVWENTSTGERYVWLMNGTTFQASVSLGVVPTDWHIRN